MDYKNTRWTGKKFDDIRMDGYFLPFADGGPFLVMLEDCTDRFLPVFSTAVNLQDFVSYMKAECQIKQITNSLDFIDSVLEGGVRVMLDPQVINDHHTKWLEVVRSGEEFKFVEGTDSLLQ